MSVSLQLARAPFAYRLLLARWLAFNLSLAAVTDCFREFCELSDPASSMLTDVKLVSDTEEKTWRLHTFLVS